MNYIGSKLSLISFLEESINDVLNENKEEKDKEELSFADAFSGTGVVSKRFKELGYKVMSNDIQYYSYVLIRHFIGNNKKLEFEKLIYRKNKYGFKSESRVYLCKDCLSCSYSNDCIKFKNKSGLKRIYVPEQFESLRQKSEENITTKEGIIERLNRSIQAEGIFSYIKSGMKYSRFRHRSMEKIVAEMKLLSFAINIKKLSSKIKSNNIGFIKYKEVI